MIWQLDLSLLTLDHVPEPYCLDLEAMRTSAKVLDAIVQVSKKTWASEACMAELIRKLDLYLDPQARLCPYGQSNTCPDRGDTLRRAIAARIQTLDEMETLALELRAGHSSTPEARHAT